MVLSAGVTIRKDGDGSPFAPASSPKASMTLDDGPSMALPAHPLGVRPAGNAYATDKNLKSAAGRFNVLPDEILLEILQYLEPTPLSFSGRTCKALYAFSRFDELWKAIIIR